MFKPIAVLTASAVAAVAATSLADASSKSPPSHRPAAPKAVSVVAVLGKQVNVPAGQFVMAYAYCPKGYYVTGGGAYNGAITVIVSAPRRDLHGWLIDGMNPDPKKRTFTETATAVCIKGSPAVPIAAAASDPAGVRQAEADYLAAHGGH